jgi:hypothetical protein
MPHGQLKRRRSAQSQTKIKEEGRAREAKVLISFTQWANQVYEGKVVKIELDCMKK